MSVRKKDAGHGAEEYLARGIETTPNNSHLPAVAVLAMRGDSRLCPRPRDKGHDKNPLGTDKIEKQCPPRSAATRASAGLRRVTNMPCTLVKGCVRHRGRGYLKSPPLRSRAFGSRRSLAHGSRSAIFKSHRSLAYGRRWKGVEYLGLFASVSPRSRA